MTDPACSFAVEPFAASPAHNLVGETTPLVGRTTEIALVAARLRQPNVRLVTLTGPGGTGKTRLAQEVAAHLLPMYADGVFFVALHAATSAADVAATIAQTIGIGADKQPVDTTLLHALADKQMLLVLDNFEQAIAATEVVATLLASTPVTVLVTSREVLRLYGEHVIAVPPLAVLHPQRIADQPFDPHATLMRYDAIRLFVERAQATDARFELRAENARAIAGICYEVDGLPLAIELAAASLRMLTPQALLLRLERRLHLLVGGARNRPTRHQTLRNTVAWSYELLSPSEQRLFRRLHVFAGGWTLDAAEAIGGDVEGDVLTDLHALLDKSLVQRTEGSADEPRFTMLETIRAFAIEQSEAHGERPTTQQTHARYFLDVFAAPRAAGSPVAMERLRDDDDNLRAALAWSETHGETRDHAMRAAWANGHLVPHQRTLEAMTPPHNRHDDTVPCDRAGLSDRELDVLRLVAQGLTNKHVAQRLIISPHTVNMHLRSIYGKLEVSTRTEATRWAVERAMV